MSTIPENMLDEVGQEFAGLQTPKKLEAIPGHGENLWEADRGVYRDACELLDSQWEKRFGEPLETRNAVAMFDGGDSFWYVMRNEHIVLVACDCVAIFAPPDSKTFADYGGPSDLFGAPVDQATANSSEFGVDAGLGSLLKRYTELANERRERSDRIEAIDSEMKPIEAALLEAYAEAGIQNARCNGLSVFIRVDRYVSKKGDVSQEQLCETLRKLGCGYMVKEGYNASSLKAKVAEWQREGVTIPAELKSLVNIGEVARITSRK